MRLRRKRIFRGVALAFAIAAFAVPTAQARPLSKWGTNPTATAAASYTPQQLRALHLRSQGMDKRYGLAARNTVSSVEPSGASVLVASSSGFAWGDAFIGAGAAIATAIVLVAGFVVITRREQPLGV